MCINNQHIPYINIVKYIGVHLDNKLRWQLLKLKMCSNIIAIPTTENSCIILYNYLFSYLLLVHGITFQKDFLVLFLPFRRKTTLIKWASICICVKFWSSSNNFQTTYPIDTKFWPHIVSYWNSPTPLITFRNFKNCDREKCLNFIFSPFNGEIFKFILRL